MTPAKRPQWNSLSFVKLQLWGTASALCSLTHNSAWKHFRFAFITYGFRQMKQWLPSDMVATASFQESSWVFPSQRITNKSNKSSWQQQRVGIWIWRVISKQGLLKNKITDLAAELLWATFSIKYSLLSATLSKNRVINIKNICSVHSRGPTVVNNMRTCVISSHKFNWKTVFPLKMTWIAEGSYKIFNSVQFMIDGLRDQHTAHVAAEWNAYNTEMHLHQ